VATLSAGQFFGEMSLMTGESRAATVVARATSSATSSKGGVSGDPGDAARSGRYHQRHSFQRQVTLGASSQVGQGTTAVQKNQLRSRIAAFFGIGIQRKP